MGHGGYFAGMDGGGTKCDVWVEFERETPPVHITGGPLNICSNPIAEVEKNLASLFDQVERQCGALCHCLGLCMGIAGFSNPLAEPFFRRQAESRAQNAAVLITSDAHVALVGALRAEEGIILVSGTGSVCYGAKAGRTHKAGGFGHLLDDEGSGYAIGRDILAAVLKVWDGRGKPTILAELLREKHGFMNASDIVTFVYDGATGKKDIAAFAPLLTAGCAAGDEICLAIADKAAKSLMELVTAVVRALCLDQTLLAVSGGVLTKEPYVKASFIELLSQTYPNLSLREPKGIFAGEGAASLAKAAAFSRDDARVSNKKTRQTHE